MINDKFTNLVANLNTGNAKSSHDGFGMRHLNDLELEAMYRSSWIGRKAVDLPVKDMLRPWRCWQAEKDVITTIEDAEKRHQVKFKIAQALTWARLYGGSVIVIGAETGNPGAPLVPARIGKGGLKYLTVLPRRMITPGERNLDPTSPLYGEPERYSLSSQTVGQVDIHPSRIIRFLGAPRPDLDVNSEGWGDSILQVIYDAIHDASLASTGTAELVHEAKIDILKIKNLASMLASDEGTRLMTKRLQNASMLKSINNTLVIDGEDEHDRVQTTFAGLPDVVMTFMQIVAGATGIPLTRFLGTSAKGLNATGEGDLKNYYDELDGQRKDDLQPKLELLDEFLWRDATGAAAPKDVYFEFNPLWQMTPKETADINKIQAETDQIYATMGMLPEDALAEGIANRLIENGTYPGFETAIEDYLKSGKSLVPEDPLLQIELANAKVQPAGNGSKGKTPARDRAPPRRSLAGIRDRLDRDAEYLSQVYIDLDKGQRH